MRIYTFLAGRPGGYMNWPGHTVTSNHRIRAVAVFVFRRWFGRSPDKCLWGTDGLECLAGDKRGNRIHITQENWRPSRDWLLPAVIKSGPLMCLPKIKPL